MSEQSTLDEIRAFRHGDDELLYGLDDWEVMTSWTDFAERLAYDVPVSDVSVGVYVYEPCRDDDGNVIARADCDGCWSIGEGIHYVSRVARFRVPASEIQTLREEACGGGQ